MFYDLIVQRLDLPLLPDNRSDLILYRSLQVKQDQVVDIALIVIIIKLGISLPSIISTISMTRPIVTHYNHSDHINAINSS